MSNSDRVVLALGGAGKVGSGIVKGLLDKGFKVAVISRDGSRLEKLRSFVSPNTKDNLTTIVGNVGKSGEICNTDTTLPPMQIQFFLGAFVKINTGVATPDHMAPGFLNHLDLGEAVAALIERRNTAHNVFTINCPADLKSVLLERNL
ncbi:uncharacterized protein si:dkey-238o13.4 [Neolamprologus brichardi]|uniref:uncharacterized protein si:dkey-238o13.4 n=1 Tax=Neolamprologus brichardi TaxID=32507 RepID=UPI001643BAC1|nr:uncharacterized protein si:dkey-238o13.4 [Neolamprologus brichardi]